MLSPSELDVIFELFSAKEGFKHSERTSGEFEVLCPGFYLVFSNYDPDYQDKGSIVSNIPILPNYKFQAYYSNVVDLTAALSYVKQRIKHKPNPSNWKKIPSGWSYQPMHAVIVMHKDYYLWSSSIFDKPNPVAGLNEAKLIVEYLARSIKKTWWPPLKQDITYERFFKHNLDCVFYSAGSWWTRDNNKHSMLLHALAHSENCK